MKQIINHLKKSKRILIASHIQPDGDAIGASLAMGLALEEIKKKIQIFNESGLPAVYQFLPSIHRIKQEPGDISAYDTAIVIDCSDLQRIGAVAEAVSRIPTVINLDHHITNTRFGHYQYIDAKAAASAEIVYRLIRAMDVPITTAMAYAIYTAIMSDTGSFRFSNTTPEAFKICHEMLEYGADPHQVAHHVYETISLNRIKLLNMLFDTIEISDDGRLSIMTLTQNMLKVTETEITDVNGLINYAKRIENVRVAALLYERANKRQPGKATSHFHVSLRSDGNVNVALIASAFGGGGHPTAAGFDIHSSLTDVKKQLYALSDRFG
ncbi:MAG: DHH family phosphoesterase [Thermodesulfobacteriota bacterium]